jgi:hypothetical protein
MATVKTNEEVMNGFYRTSAKRSLNFISAGLLLASTFAYGQSSSTNSGWKRVGDAASPANSASNAPPPADSNPEYGAPPSAAAPGPYQNAPSISNGPYNQQPMNGQPSAPPVPAVLNVPAGTFLNVRVNQLLSSDRNQPGDAFSATLTQPLVVNGVVIAEPGQTVGGRVVEVQKAGRVEGVARLRIQLIELTLVDGQQIPIQSQLISRKGDTSVERDAAAIGGTAALGAAIGPTAGWGRGAAIGAGAGAAIGTLGVLLTRGEPSVIYPEQELTFRLEAPLLVSTDRAPQVFRYVQPNEYDRPSYNTSAPQLQRPVAPAYPYYAQSGPYYGYPGYPYAYGYPYWGPSIGFYFGRGYYGRPYYGRVYYGGGYHHTKAPSCIPACSGGVH